LTPLIATALAVDEAQVDQWFQSMPELGGDTLGRVPGLKRMLAERGLQVADVASACGVRPEDMHGWVYERRSLPRYLIPRLSAHLSLDREEFLRQARTSNLTREGTYLTELRRARGMSQTELARRIGRNCLTVSGWERGLSVPMEVSVRRVAKALRVDVDVLTRNMNWSPVETHDRPHSAMAVHERLRMRRLQEGLTAEQLARCVGVTGQTVRRWENGDFHPRRVTMARLESVLGIQAGPGE
jgi:transcriptional regulator with XRE-family HTH domain